MNNQASDLIIPLLFGFFVGIFIAAFVFKWILGMRELQRQTERSAMYLKRIAEKLGVSEEEIKEVKSILDKKY
jgi:hypothetical protein